MTIQEWIEKIQTEMWRCHRWDIPTDRIGYILDQWEKERGEITEAK
jgi:hypothetical protein